MRYVPAHDTKKKMRRAEPWPGPQLHQILTPPIVRSTANSKLALIRPKRMIV
jgi:hypothetical protein